MILNVRDFPRLVPPDFGDAVRNDIINCCLSDCPVREDGVVEANREVVAIITNSDVDHHKTILGADAFRKRLDTFRANPIVLPEHQRKLPNGMAAVVGVATGIVENRSDNSLVATTRFSQEPIGQNRWAHYRAGELRQFSVGFVDHLWSQRAGGIKKLEDGEIREYSTIAVGSNDSARVIDYISGRLSAHAGRSDDAGRTRELLSAIDELRAEVASLRAENVGFQRMIAANEIGGEEISDDVGEGIRRILSRV